VIWLRTVSLARAAHVRRDHARARCRSRSDQAGRDDHIGPDDEHERRDEEQPGAGRQSTQVDGRENGEDDQTGNQLVLRQAREGRHQGGDASGDGHRHREHVVDDEGGRGQEAGVVAEVGLGHLIGAAPLGVGLDHLAVGEHEERQQHHDDDRDGLNLRERARSGGGQDDEHRLRPVRDRGQGVEREGGKSLQGRDLLARRVAGPGSGAKMWPEVGHLSPDAPRARPAGGPAGDEVSADGSLLLVRHYMAPTRRMREESPSARSRPRSVPTETT
jgi:hypothetical protein